MGERVKRAPVPRILCRDCGRYLELGRCAEYGRTNPFQPCHACPSFVLRVRLPDLRTQ